MPHSNWPSLEQLKASACSGLNPQLQQVEKPKKESKFHNKRIELEGHSFDSLKESRRFVYLKQLQIMGEISQLKVHQVFQLSVCRYEADFTYVKAGTFVCEDIKSPITRTAAYKLKRKLMLAELHIDITEV